MSGSVSPRMSRRALGRPSAISRSVRTTLYFSEADLSNAYYHPQLPFELRHLFTLRRVRARGIGLIDFNGELVREGAWVHPGLRACPKEWTWP
eukprot:730033-Pyramimonas_sp.AAC.1